MYIPLAKEPEILKAKIRGIYTTGITKLLLDARFAIVQPTRAIRERFKIEDSGGEADISIGDKEDHNGIVLFGTNEALEETFRIFKENFPDAIIHRIESKPYAMIEFPYLSKQKFDELRNTVFTTIPKHHFYKAVGGSFGFTVDFAENLLEAGISEKTITDNLNKTVSETWKIGATIIIEHIKLDGYPITLTPGKIMEIRNNGTILLKREFHWKGFYDGLNVPKDPNDYAITEVRDGDWTVKSVYYSKNGELKGEYYNINTPIEISLKKVRYVDLAVDVLRWPDGRVEIVDSAEPDAAYQKQVISKWLFDEAKKRAEELQLSLLKT